MPAAAIIRLPDVLQQVGAASAAVLPGIGDRRRREVDPLALVTALGQPLRVQTGAAAQIEYRPILPSSALS